MRKNARWSGMNVNGLNMGGLGMSMGLRKGHGSNSELHSRNQVSERLITKISDKLIYPCNSSKENPLMGGFASLREYLNTVQGNVDVDDGLLVR